MNMAKREDTTGASTGEKKKKTASVPHWLAELADAHSEVAGSQEFVEGLKEDFFSHRVFVFTPKGDVIDLPAQSTPIDFAYAIHSDLGDHLQGARVNGKMVSFETLWGMAKSSRYFGATPPTLPPNGLSLPKQHLRAATSAKRSA
jgi:(p)ppGpp synthase/HD superfamily hydrolase